MCCFDWLGGLECRASGFAASSSLILTSLRYIAEGIASPAPCFASEGLSALSPSYEVHKIGGGGCERI